MATKSNFKGFAEFSDEYVFRFDKTVPVKNQIIYEDEHHYLLNVLKIYTNNDYFGVQYSCLNKQSNTFIYSFRCKDRGFSETLVDNKESFLDHYKVYLYKDSYHVEKNVSEFFEKKANFLKEYDLTFVYNSAGNYVHSTITIDKSTCRGVYGAITESYYRELLKGHPFAVLNREPIEEEILEYLVKPTLISLSNVITRENTAYSTIKVYHKTEI